MNSWDEVYDFVVIGSGGGASGALKAHAEGMRCLIVEKNPHFGGSTGLSGGVWWIPNNPLMKKRGYEDSYARGRQYLDAVVGEEQPGSTDARRRAYIENGPRLCEFLMRQGMEMEAVEFWPDYYADLPGGESRSRSVVPKLFNLKELGSWLPKLATYPGFDMPLHSNDVSPISTMMTTLAGKKAVGRMVKQIIVDFFLGRKTRGQGAAMQGRMLKLLLDKKVDLWLNSPVVDLIEENGKVAGVLVRRDGKLVRVAASRGVLISSGGFARNQKLRDQYLPTPTDANLSSANQGDTGEMLEAAIQLGADTHNTDAAIWVLTSRCPDGSPAPGQIINGNDYPFLHVIDIGKPGLIMVNQKGQRFVNESASYMHVGEEMYRTASVPSWIITDHSNRKRYPWGGTTLGAPKKWLESGYLRRADTIEELAVLCGIDPDGLQQTVTRFNRYCEEGKDPDFGRGANAYNHWNGDFSNKPNPSLGPLRKPPYYAITAFPGDVGTFGGLVCDENSRVLRKDGTPIEGLYAAGNCTASVMGKTYPGAGASIGASYVFSYLAAAHASGKP